MSMSLLCLLLQRYVPIPLSCIDTCLDFLVHPNVQLRKNAAKSVAAFCHLQKPPRTYAEKSIERREDRPRPGNRDDNLWLTFNDYRPAETQVQWEETCFLDELFHGYYQWPKTIRYALNKRERYSEGQMPADVFIVFERFRDQKFVKKLIELLVLDENETKASRMRFLMFKVRCAERFLAVNERVFRVSFETSAWHSSTSFSSNFIS